MFLVTVEQIKGLLVWQILNVPVLHSATVMENFTLALNVHLPRSFSLIRNKRVRYTQCSDFFFESFLILPQVLVL